MLNITLVRKTTAQQSWGTIIGNPDRYSIPFRCLVPLKIENQLAKHWAYPGVKTIRSLGLLSGGYDNNYRLEEKVDRWLCESIFNNALKKAGLATDQYLYFSEQPTSGKILKMVTMGLGENVATSRDARELLIKENILTPQLDPYFAGDNQQPEAAEVIMLTANLYNQKKAADR